MSLTVWDWVRLINVVESSADVIRPLMRPLCHFGCVTIIVFTSARIGPGKWVDRVDDGGGRHVGCDGDTRKVGVTQWHSVSCQVLRLAGGWKNQNRVSFPWYISISEFYLSYVDWTSHIYSPGHQHCFEFVYVRVDFDMQISHSLM